MFDHFSFERGHFFSPFVAWLIRILIFGGSVNLEITDERVRKSIAFVFNLARKKVENKNTQRHFKTLMVMFFLEITIEVHLCVCHVWFVLKSHV